MEDPVLEVEYPVALEPKEDMGRLTNDILEIPKVDDMRRLTNDVLKMEYPVVEEHIVEFHEIFEDGQANREENNNDRRLYCKYCGKNFKSHNYVKMHERWHRGELSHHCPECNRAFRYPSELKKHTTIHTGQLPYKCEDCNLRFNKAQAAHEHRLRDHVRVMENSAQDSQSLQPPMVFQMNNNYQPMSFEVVLPNPYTQAQGKESELEPGNDPLTEGFSAECYARPASRSRSSVIKPNYFCSKELNYAGRKEPIYKQPDYVCSKELNYTSRKEPIYKQLDYDGSKELNYAGRQQLTYDCRMENVEGLEEPTVWRESARWEEEMQFGRNYGTNNDIENGREATDVDQFMENVDNVEKNYGGHAHIEKRNMEECSKCRRIIEYENEIARLRNHNCAHN